MSAKVKRSLKVSDPQLGVMFGLFVFAFALGALPNLFNLISDGAVSDNAVNGFRNVRIDAGNFQWAVFDLPSLL